MTVLFVSFSQNVRVKDTTARAPKTYIISYPKYPPIKGAIAPPILAQAFEIPTICPLMDVGNISLEIRNMSENEHVAPYFPINIVI